MRFQVPDRLRPAGHRSNVLVNRRDLDRIGHLLTIIEGPDAYRVLPKMVGGAQLLVTSPAVATALTASQVAFLGPLIGIPQDPLVIALCYIPTITTITAASTTTLNFNRTDTPAVIGGATLLAATGQTSFGATFMMCVVPFGIPAANGVSVSGANTTPAGVPTGTATQPMILTVLGLS